MRLQFSGLKHTAHNCRDTMGSNPSRRTITGSSSVGRVERLERLGRRFKSYLPDQILVLSLLRDSSVWQSTGLIILSSRVQIPFSLPFLRVYGLVRLKSEGTPQFSLYGGMADTVVLEITSVKRVQVQVLLETPNMLSQLSGRATP